MMTYKNDHREFNWTEALAEAHQVYTDIQYRPYRKPDDDIRAGRFKRFRTMQELIDDLTARGPTDGN